MVFTPLPSIAVAGISAAVFIHVVRYISYTLSPRGKLPIAPRSEVSWWLGHEYLVAKNELGVEFGRWTRLLGLCFALSLRFGKPILCTLTVRETVRSVLLAAEFALTSIKSPAFQPIVVEFAGRGVGWAEGDEHKFQRRMISPAFSLTSAVKKMAPCVTTCVDKLIVRLQDNCRSRGVFNMCNYIPAVSSDVVRRVGFGYDLGPDSPEGGAILDAWKTDVGLARCASFAGFLAPLIIGIAPWVANLPIDALQDGVAKKLIHEVGRKMLQEPPNMDGTEMFSILVRESWDGKKNPNGERRLDDATLFENILSFFVAGLETTSGTIHLILHDLAQYPYVQTKLREEILAADSSEVDVIETLPYLNRGKYFSTQLLRLHPSVRDTHRVAAHDNIVPLKSPVTLTSGGDHKIVPVRAGDVCAEGKGNSMLTRPESFIIPFMVPNTDPDVWGPYGARFILEPWLEGGNIPNSVRTCHTDCGGTSPSLRMGPGILSGGFSRSKKSN
ncbi:cytochrome P450 [Mycena olivaceomarginata]|nr:cytochrome P450 [Mycena olivaceomarginata]